MEVTLQMSESARLREAMDRAKSRALAWTPSFGPEPTWQIGAAAIIAIYQNALHEAGCDGCTVKNGAECKVGIGDGAGQSLFEGSYDLCKEVQTNIIADRKPSFLLNKKSHHLAFEDETESFVRVIIEPNEQTSAK